MLLRSCAFGLTLPPGQAQRLQGPTILGQAPVRHATLRVMMTALLHLSGQALASRLFKASAAASGAASGSAAGRAKPALRRRGMMYKNFILRNWYFVDRPVWKTVEMLKMVGSSQ